MKTLYPTNRKKEMEKMFDDGTTEWWDEKYGFYKTKMLSQRSKQGIDMTGKEESDDLQIMCYRSLLKWSAAAGAVYYQENIANLPKEDPVVAAAVTDTEKPWEPLAPIKEPS